MMRIGIATDQGITDLDSLPVASALTVAVLLSGRRQPISLLGSPT
jgi:hypothetical protein